MLSNLLLIVLMIGGTFAAPWKVGFDFNAPSSQLSQGTANIHLPASSTLLATRDLITASSRSPGPVFSSLTSMFPITLPPDTLNSTLLPPPPTSLSTSKSLPLSVLASTSSDLGPVVTSFPVLPTISIAAPSMSTPTAASSSATLTTPAATSSSTTLITVATSPKSGPVISTTRTSISVLTITENKTSTFFGTKSRNMSHIDTPFTSPCGSRLTTLHTSTKINYSSISSASGSYGTGGPCLKDTYRRCPSIINNQQDSDNGSGINQPPSNDFGVDVTVNGGDFKGGQPFQSSATYHGNCTNGILDTGMGSIDVKEPCGRDLMCWAGVLMASLGSVVTEIMNPTPKGTVPIWCSNGIGDTNSSTKMSGSGSGMPWPASDTGKWNTSMAPGSMIATPGTLSNTKIQPTGTLGIQTPPTTLEPLLLSLSHGMIDTAVPTDTGSMVTNTALPALNQRSVRTASSENAAFSGKITLLSSVLSTDAASVAATASKQLICDGNQDGWPEWHTVRPVPTITQRSIATASPGAAELSINMSELGSLVSSEYSGYMKTFVTVIPIPNVIQRTVPSTTQSVDRTSSWTTLTQRAVTSLDAFDSMTSAHPLNPTALSELTAWLENFGSTQRAVPTAIESVNSGYMHSITQRQLITTTVSNSYTTATYDYWELSPFTWAVNSVQVSEALTLLPTRMPNSTNTA